MRVFRDVFQDSSLISRIIRFTIHKQKAVCTKGVRQIKKLPIKTIYYNDEQNDEFSRAQITPKKITKDYEYIFKNPLKILGSFIAYRLIATPIAFFYSKIRLGQRVRNRRVLRFVNKKQGFFLFANHTQDIGDAFMPHIAIFPKRAYTVVHPNNVSMPILGRINPALGALPIPSEIRGLRPFSNAIRNRIKGGFAVVIYPEAHIWPYYIGIRDFPDTAMKYPVELGAPSFTMTNTYKKRKIGLRPRVITYIDGPFYPDTSLPKREQVRELREQIYKKMRERSLESNCEFIRYVKNEDKNNKEN